MNKILKKASGNMAKLTEKHIIIILEKEVVPKIKEIILNDYNMMLSGRVTDRKSRTNPDIYIDEFTDRLEGFSYITITDRGVRLTTPDINNFDFSGRLKVVEDILEGVAGSYVEVDMDQLEKIYGKKPIVVDTVDASVTKKERIIKLRKTADVLNRLRVNKIQAVDYPFSNTSPIDIFYNINKDVDKELLDPAINAALKLAQKELTKTFKG